MQKCFITSILLFGIFLNAGFAQINRPNAPKNENTEQLTAQVVNAISENNLNEATTILQKLLISQPRNVAVQTLAGITADRQNDLIAAEKYFANAARLAPNQAETRNNYGAILVRLNRQLEAAKEFSASLKINPNQPSALINLAQIRFSENNFPAARTLFERVAIINSDTEIFRSLVLISLQLKEKNRAISDFDKYFERLKIDTPTPTNFEQAVSLGKILKANDLFDESRKLFEFVLIRDSNNINALVQLSQIYLQQKQLPDAGRLLESAVAKGVTDARIYFALAEVYKTGGYFENAVPAMLLAIENDPKNEFYYAHYGLLLIDTKAPAAAIIRLNEALGKFPNSPKILLALGIAQITDGHPIDAKKSLENALKFEPNSIPILAYLANVMVDQAQYTDALKIYEHALNIEENAVLHYLVADTMLKLPESNQAEIQKHLERSISLDEKFAQAHFALGKVYARDEKWQFANTEFEKATRFAPELSEAFYQLGRTLARLKRVDESKAAFDQYKKLNESQSVKSETDRQALVRRLANVRF